MSDEALIKNIDMDLSDVSAAPPLIDKQTLKCKVGEAGVIRTDKGMRRCVLPLILEEPGVDTQGQPVQVGFRITHSFLLDESGGWTAARAKQEFLRTKMAVLGLDEAAAKAASNDLNEWVGKLVNATFEVRTDKEGNPQQNVKKLTAVK